MKTLLTVFAGKITSAEFIIVFNLIALPLYFYGCSNDDPSRTQGPDVYIAGSEGNDAKYWKNGKGVGLTMLTESYAEASSIVVSSGDVYVAGSIHAQGVTTAVYWKNGEMVTLSDGTTGNYASSIAISGSDVYVAGGELDQGNYPRNAKYWKNGEEVLLTNGLNWATASSITLSGDDVYVAGSEFDVTEVVAKYWKNGIPVIVGDGATYSRANGIVVTGGDVYIVGIENGQAKYWRNGDPVILQGGIDAYSIAVDGNDVYVTGRLENPNYVAMYWKNANTVILSESLNMKTAISIAVLDNNVYVAGTMVNSSPVFFRTWNNIVASWKNGGFDLITDGSEDATVKCIFINK